MKRIAVFLAAVLIAQPVAAESKVTSTNGEAYGTFSGRVQSLSMYRDYDQAGNGANSSVGVVLDYAAPFRSFDAALAYNYASALFENNKAGMLANDDIHVLNEAWARFDLGAVGLHGTRFLLGRKIIDGEVFRADDFRQKARSIEGVHFEIDNIPDARVILGHATRMSSWIQSGDKAEFRDFGNDSDGITWAEGVYRGVKDLEIAVFDAYSWNSANLVGARISWRNPERGGLVAYYRHEADVGRGSAHTADAFGISVPVKVGEVTIEPGFFAVHGDRLLFQEATTGINHPLGSSMMIFAGQFNGATDTAYLKAVAKVADSSLYLLYNHTRQGNSGIDGQELNFVVKYPVTKNFTVSVKSGIGRRDVPDSENPLVTDTRLFVTYQF